MWPERWTKSTKPNEGDLRVEPGTGNTQVYTNGNWSGYGGSHTHSISHSHGTTGDYTLQGTMSYSRKKPKVEEEVVDETVEEWEEEREDGTKVIVRKRTKRTKTTTTRDLYEPDYGGYTTPHWNPNQWTTINTGTSTTSLDTNRFDYNSLYEKEFKISDEQVQKLMEQLKIDAMDSKTIPTAE